MAETDSRQQNQAFLQQLERQRLQKPCLRNIDLRGKVAGECQAYQIGQRTHYLDDRSYLLLKALLERSNNQFTVGVYEAWQKALQLLTKQDTAANATQQKPILSRDSESFQLLDFDSRIVRREPRINITTTALIDAEELRYHASTLNISASGMRLSMRRTQQLQTEQTVLISLPLLQESAPAKLLTDMPYRIKSLEHSAQHTIAIIQRQRDDDLTLTEWFINWLNERQQLSAIDLDSELFNLAREYYLRLFCQYFSSPFFWCDAFADEVLFIHSNDAAGKILSSLRTNALLERLPLATVNDAGLLVAVNEAGKCCWAAGDNQQQIKQLLSQPAIRSFYYLQKQPVAFDAHTVKETLAPLIERQPAVAETLANNILKCGQLLTAIDITAICQQLIADNQIAADTSEIPQTAAKNLPAPQPLQLHIYRHNERYEIHTPILLHANQQPLSLTTNELSAGGLSVKLPASQIITNGSRVTIDFVRWQQQSKLKLTGIPYEVRSQQSWQDTTLLGLRRLTEHCPAALNQFFDQVLAENKPTLSVCNDDLQLSLSSQLFANQLSSQLADVLLFFATDSDNNRILQAVAATHNNAAQQYQVLWQALGQLAGRLTQPLKLPISDLQNSLSFGIYAFRRSAQHEWQIGSDLSFEDSTSKQIFIRRAVTAGEQLFFSCHLQPIRSGAWSAMTDLQQQLNQLRRHNSHKVKQIRETLNSLFAMGQLTDITDLIRSQYR